MNVIWLETIILVALIVITITVILNDRLMAVVILSCSFSFFAMFLYIIVGAADVAFTEAVIGTISTVYFVIALRALDKKDNELR